MKTFIVYSKSDDYGACKTELVETTLKNAKEYYHHREVAEQDVVILKKYLDLVPYSEEKERSNDGRFYGN